MRHWSRLWVSEVYICTTLMLYVHWGMSMNMLMYFYIQCWMLNISLRYRLLNIISNYRSNVKMKINMKSLVVCASIPNGRRTPFRTCIGMPKGQPSSESLDGAWRHWPEGGQKAQPQDISKSDTVREENLHTTIDSSNKNHEICVAVKKLYSVIALVQGIVLI